MTIAFDASTQRATHVESGLAIEFVRYGLYTREGDIYFKIYWQGKSHEFEATWWDEGLEKTSKNYPDMNPYDQLDIANKLNEFDFKTSNIGVDINSALRMLPNFLQVFLEVWHRVVSEGRTSKVTVHLAPNFNPVDGRWSYTP